MKVPTFYVAGLAAFAVYGALGQSTPKPAFDVLSVKLTPKEVRSAAPVIGPGRLRYVGALMRNLLWAAFGVMGYEIVGLDSASENVAVNGPASAYRYTVDATFPEGTTQAQIALMYQSLLADRFKLVYHWEKRETKGLLSHRRRQGREADEIGGAEADLHRRWARPPSGRPYVDIRSL